MRWPLLAADDSVEIECHIDNESGPFVFFLLLLILLMLFFLRSRTM